jgi:urease accessory protein
MRMFELRGNWWTALTAVLTLLLWPCYAEAHLVNTGLGPVYDGAGHLVSTPEDLVPVLALALFAGLRGAGPGRRALFLLPVAWLVGGVVGLTVNWSPTFPFPALSFLILGSVVASDFRLSPTAVAALAVGLGIVHGFLNGVAMKPASVGALGLIGMAATIFVIVALVAAFVVSLKRPWTRILVRVAGSWIAATGLLLLGWSMRGVG